MRYIVDKLIITRLTAVKLIVESSNKPTEGFQCCQMNTHLLLRSRQKLLNGALFTRRAECRTMPCVFGIPVIPRHGAVCKTSYSPYMHYVKCSLYAARQEEQDTALLLLDVCTAVVDLPPTPHTSGDFTIMLYCKVVHLLFKLKRYKSLRESY